MTGAGDIRRAVVDDAAAIARVHVRAWQHAYPGLVPQDYLDALDAEERAGAWAHVLGTTAWPHTGVFVAIGPDTRGGADGEVVGFSAISPSRDEDADPTAVGEIQTVYVDPTAWGTGTGSRLVARTLDELRAAGFRRATLWTLDTNERARRFYERRGWALDGVSKRHDWGAFVATDVRYVVELR
ncbi:MAG TPA: GNAT family N-acetyltransferase [Acidimicrobiales bacterium]|nr:GNAT family N-acetyltransferase [Acidimicrobiales bacterium]